ncbi:DEAD/DEAH box helicase [Sphingomonas sp. 3-13AW]|uniref:DEAD/DEAH box helicase n=1 Tax=Sphingomonas sp. 3-13AW TaxID=3050450 RepID=UPI003BB4ED43
MLAFGGIPSGYERRGYQQRCTVRTRERLKVEGSALIVMPTGSGKTAAMGFTIAEEMIETVLPKVLILQGSDFLIRQNKKTIGELTAHLGAALSVVKARRNDWTGDIVFGTAQSVSKPWRLKQMPFFTHLVVDEAHHAASPTYRAIIERAREINPDVRILFYTATPNRSDGQTLAFAAGIAFQITYSELIDLGILVPVRTFTIDTGFKADLENIPLVGAEYDMTSLGKLLDKQVHHDAVIDHWVEKRCNNRQTVAFCPTIPHAEALAQAFRDRGYVAECVHSKKEEENERILGEYAAGRIQVVINVMMLAEGWDDQRTACVINLRMMASELTFLQAVGRGMRSLDPLRYPGESKTNCILLDFTGAAERHRSIEVRVLEEQEAAMRVEAHPRPANDNSNIFPCRPKEVVRHFGMREIEIMRQAKPRFVRVASVCDAMVARNQNAWAGAFCHGGEWYALSRVGKDTITVLGCATSNEAMTWCDRFLMAEASGSCRGLEMRPPTADQKKALMRYLVDAKRFKNAYEAACVLDVTEARTAIKHTLGKVRAAA